MRKPDSIVINKGGKKPCQIVPVAVPADHRVKMKGSEKMEKC